MYKPQQRAYNAIYGAKSNEINSNYFNPYQTSNKSYGNKIHSNYGMSTEAYGTMKQHLNNRNIRRVEPDTILTDYRNTAPKPKYGNYNNTIYHNQIKSKPQQLGGAPIYSTQTLPCEGEEALQRVRSRVQESLRKRGCLVGENKVKMNYKPGDVEKPNIDAILKAHSNTGLKRKQVDNQGLLLASKVAIPPSQRTHNKKNSLKMSKIEPVEKIDVNNVSITPSGPEVTKKISCDRSELQKPKTPPKIEKEEEEKKNEYVYKNLTYEEDKENNVNQNNLSVFGHTTLSKMNARCIKEDIKKEQNNKRVYKYGDGSRSSQGNPLRADMEKHNKLSQDVQEKVGCYTTTSGSTYKRWGRSAFQTVTSRMEERPYWANPNVGGHFVRSLSKSKKINNAPGITLSVTGNNVYQGNKNKRPSNVLNSSSTKKNTFKSEYMRTFGDEINV